MTRNVREGADGELKNFLTVAFDGVTGNKANSLLRRGQVMVNGTVTSQYNAGVKAGDTVAVNFTRPFVVFRHPRVQMVYEDNDIMVVNKGYGLLSVGRGTAKKELNAYDILKDYLKSKSPANKIFIVHRLDKDTSGLMMFAKNVESKEAMQHNWNNMVLDRKYVAVLEGSLPDDEGEIRSYLGETSQHEVYSSHKPEEGKLAVTHYRVLMRGGGYTLVEFSLTTGRKNQIRVHASRELGHPIVGDRRYGASKSPIGRLALHARTLNFAHPSTKKLMQFDTPVPKRFYTILKGGNLKGGKHTGDKEAQDKTD